MHKQKGKAGIPLLLLVIALSAAVYYIVLSFSEGKVLSPGSIDGYVLIPSILRSEEISRLGKVRNYYYSAADGPKPRIASVNIMTYKQKETVHQQVRRYFLSMGFKENEDHELWNGKQEVSVSFEKNEERGWIVDIALLDHIN